MLLILLFPSSTWAKYSFDTKWGERKPLLDAPEGTFNRPAGISANDVDNVYVADTFLDRIQSFDGIGTFQIMWGFGVDDGDSLHFQICTSSCRKGYPGSGDGQLYMPESVTVDLDGYVYVADTYNNRIQKFKPGVEGHAYDLQWGNEGTDDGQFKKPKGVAVDQNGYAYVVDTDNHRIQRFKPAGEGHAYDTQWGSEGTDDGQFNSPGGVAIDGEGYVYIADTNNHRIQRFKPADEGHAYDTQWGGEGTGDGQFKQPKGVAVDPGGNVYVADTGNHRIQIFGSEGSFISKWGSYCSLFSNQDDPEVCDGLFNSPSDLSIDPNGNVYVVETWNYRIQRFHEIPGNTASPTISGTPQVGRAMICSEGIWDLAQINFSYQWQRNGEDIATATGSIYAVVTADVDTDLTCRVTATNENGSSFATSNPVRPVSLPPSPPSSSPLPPPIQPLQPPQLSPPEPVVTPPVEETYESACNLKITSPRIKIGKSMSVKLSRRYARRLFTGGLKGYVRWGEVSGKNIICKGLKMAILQKRGHSYYVPGTKARVSPKYLSTKNFPTEGFRFLKKKRVGKLTQKRISGKRQTKISFREFDRKSKLGKKARKKLKKKRYRGTYYLIYMAQVDGKTIKKSIMLKTK